MNTEVDSEFDQRVEEEEKRRMEDVINRSRGGELGNSSLSGYEIPVKDLPESRIDKALRLAKEAEAERNGALDDLFRRREKAVHEHLTELRQIDEQLALLGGRVEPNDTPKAGPQPPDQTPVARAARGRVAAALNVTAPVAVSNKRRPKTAAEKKVISERVKQMWAERKKKEAKGK